MPNGFADQRLIEAASVCIGLLDRIAAARSKEPTSLFVTRPSLRFVLGRRACGTQRRANARPYRDADSDSIERHADPDPETHADTHDDCSSVAPVILFVGHFDLPRGLVNQSDWPLQRFVSR